MKNYSLAAQPEKKENRRVRTLNSGIQLLVCFTDLPWGSSSLSLSLVSHYLCKRWMVFTGFLYGNWQLIIIQGCLEIQVILARNWPITLILYFFVRKQVELERGKPVLFECQCASHCVSFKFHHNDVRQGKQSSVCLINQKTKVQKN